MIIWLKAEPKFIDLGQMNFYVRVYYYNPEVGRFLNADDITILHMTKGEVLGANLFVYCENNPVMKSDPSGYFSWYNFAKHLKAGMKYLFQALVTLF